MEEAKFLLARNTNITCFKIVHDHFEEKKIKNEFNQSEEEIKRLHKIIEVLTIITKREIKILAQSRLQLIPISKKYLI